MYLLNLAPMTELLGEHEPLFMGLRQITFLVVLALET